MTMSVGAPDWGRGLSAGTAGSVVGGGDCAGVAEPATSDCGCAGKDVCASAEGGGGALVLADARSPATMDDVTGGDPAELAAIHNALDNINMYAHYPVDPLPSNPEAQWQSACLFARAQARANRQTGSAK